MKDHGQIVIYNVNNKDLRLLPCGTPVEASRRDLDGKPKQTEYTLFVSPSGMDKILPDTSGRPSLSSLACRKVKGTLNWVINFETDINPEMVPLLLVPLQNLL